MRAERPEVSAVGGAHVVTRRQLPAGKLLKLERRVLLQRQDYLRLPRWEELFDELFLEIDESFVEINAMFTARLLPRRGQAAPGD